MKLAIGLLAATLAAQDKVTLAANAVKSSGVTISATAPLHLTKVNSTQVNVTLDVAALPTGTGQFATILNPGSGVGQVAMCVGPNCSDGASSQIFQNFVVTKPPTAPGTCAGPTMLAVDKDFLYVCVPSTVAGSPGFAWRRLVLGAW